MTSYQKIYCPNCGSDQIIKADQSALGIQRYRCQHQDCATGTFMLNYCYKAYEKGIKKQVVDMSINGSEIWY